MSILLNLVSQFSDNKQENIATLALYSILDRSKHAVDGFRDFLIKQFDWRTPIYELVIQERQAGCGQPDLMGRGRARENVLFVELKFWAGLTINQPNAYIEALASGGLLLVVAPSARKSELWSKLRCQLGDHTAEPKQTIAHVGDKVLALTSGLELIDALLNSTRDCDSDAYSDLCQLRALWGKFDDPEFPIITVDELDNRRLPNLVMGLHALPDKIAQEVSVRPNAELIRRKELTRGCFEGAELRVGLLKGWVTYSPQNWKAYGQSPIWFETNRAQFEEGENWERTRTVFANWAGMTAGPLRAETVPDWKAIGVPLRVKPNATESEILRDMSDQLGKLSEEVSSV